jgi:predicted dehydrogenase
MHAMVQAIHGQGQAAPDFEQGWMVERIQEAARRSAAERRWVKLEEVV